MRLSIQFWTALQFWHFFFFLFFSFTVRTPGPLENKLISEIGESILNLWRWVHQGETTSQYFKAPNLTSQQQINLRKPYETLPAFRSLPILSTQKQEISSTLFHLFLSVQKSLYLLQELNLLYTGSICRCYSVKWNHSVQDAHVNDARGWWLFWPEAIVYI